MNAPQFKALKKNDILRKRLAKLMAKFCFRDTKLEELHDRIIDEEMKALMIDVVDYCYDFLMGLCSPHGADIIEDLKRRDELPEWNDPVPMIRRHL
jgi:hypothetical protein